MANVPQLGFTPEDCPERDRHGKPFLYCGYCPWQDPDDVIEGKSVEPKPLMHECIMEAQRDTFSYVEQYMVHCKCHDGNTWKSWRPGDELGSCPGGTAYPDPRTLLKRNE
jgi:hypothetical protein